MAFINIEGTGVLYDVSDVNSGSGNYDSFLRLQSHGDEEGFNTDDPHEADNKEGVFTHSVQFSSMQIVTEGGIDYYEFRLDLNEGNATGDPPITLEDLRFFYSAAPADGSDFDNDFADLNEVFDLSSALSLTDVHTGSGSDDYIFRVPTSLFPDKTGYFTLYSEFSGADGGFEEWRVLADEIGNDGLPAIHLEKTANPTSFGEGDPTDVTFTYVLTSQSSNTDPLRLTSFIDDNATPGNTSDDIDLLTGASGTNLGIYYVSGDTNGDGLLQNTETWNFQVTINDLNFNAGTTRTNVAQVFAEDDEGNSVDDADDAIVTVSDVPPAITLVKDASSVSILEGQPTNITYTYTLTSQSATTDPLTITELVDDNATPLDLTDDIDLLEGVDGTHPLGIHYVSGDADNDQLLDSTETWVFNYMVNGVTLNAGETRTNVAAVTAEDDEGNEVGDDDDATVTGEDVLPAINIEKVASLTQIQAGATTPVTFTYTLTNTSPSPFDPLTLVTLVDDNGTPGDTSDDVDLLAGTHFVGGDTDGDTLLDTDETWTFSYTTDVTLAAGETRTNIVSVTGHDDEDNPVSDSDDAAITAFNLGRTPGFWSNNGSKLWDGDSGTFPKAGGLGILGPNSDLMYKIHDTDGDGDVDSVGGVNGLLMIGDWDKDGVADATENVLIISRDDALSFLDASQKLQQDGRYMLARDVVASWLNYLGGSFVGDSDDPSSAMHYIDEGVAWLIEATTDENHLLTKSDLSAGTKVATNSAAWNTGYDFNGTPGVQHDLPAFDEHDLGDDVNLDIIGGGTIHAGLDHYNNFGFI
ncbi:MAG TPA: hypothetical protein VM531_06410 [Sphingomicrobium sp.]|nr:hypothetical protein [Sphingomicrobium sp.]